MVAEMRAARTAQLLPRLVPTVVGFAPGLVYLRVTNVGPGPALSVVLELRLEPGEWVRRWTVGAMAQGENHDFYPRDNEQGQFMRFPAMAERYQFFRIVGTCNDALGNRHAVDDRFDIREWWTYIGEAAHRLDRDWSEQAATQLKKIADELSDWKSERRQAAARESFSRFERWQWTAERYKEEVLGRLSGRRARLVKWLRRT